jgi:hypothetical protein
VLVREGASPDSVAAVTSSSHDFVIWGTRRRPWQSMTTITGDAGYAGRVLDGIKII